MAEVKLRTRVVYALMDGKLHVGFKATTIEVIYLQFRKMLELIAIGSLVANKDVYSKAHESFIKHKRADYIIKDIERLNSNFYPQPIIQKPSGVSGVKMEWLERPQDYLTKDDLIKLYGKCGIILHSENPYGSQIDYGYYESKMQYWGSRIMNLLNAHYIRLVNDPNLYLIQMGSKDEAPSHCAFAPTSKLKD